MDEKILDAAVEKARHAAQKAANYESETYLAVLLVSLLRESTGPLGTAGLEHRSVTGGPGGPRGKAFSAPEYFAAKSRSTEIDKVVLAGYFLERHSEVPSYSIREIRDCLVSAKVSIPKNLNLAMIQAVQKGWMMEVPTGKRRGKAWELTQSGERRVEEMAKPTS